MIIEATEVGGFNITKLEYTKDVVVVSLEKDYYFFTCTFYNNKNNHYLSIMDDAYIRAKGVTYNNK